LTAAIHRIVPAPWPAATLVPFEAFVAALDPAVLSIADALALPI
jgi:hypothetical protein